MSANIWIDKDNNCLYASGKSLFEFIEEIRERAKNRVWEIPKEDFQKQTHSEIEKLITSEFTIGRVTFGKPVITKLEPEGKNYVTYQKIPFEGDPGLLRHSPTDANFRQPIFPAKRPTPTKKPTLARSPIGKIIESKDSRNGREIEVKLIIKGDVINDMNTSQRIEAEFKNNLDLIKKYTDTANWNVAHFNKYFYYDVGQSIKDRKDRLKGINEINKDLQAE